jgi:hypothetical protein
MPLFAAFTARQLGWLLRAWRAHRPADKRLLVKTALRLAMAVSLLWIAWVAVPDRLRPAVARGMEVDCAARRDDWKSAGIGLPHAGMHQAGYGPSRSVRVCARHVKAEGGTLHLSPERR